MLNLNDDAKIKAVNVFEELTSSTRERFQLVPTVNYSLLITHDSTLKVLSTSVKCFQINYSAKLPLTSLLLYSRSNCESDGWCVMWIQTAFLMNFVGTCCKYLMAVLTMCKREWSYKTLIKYKADVRFRLTKNK